MKKQYCEILENKKIANQIYKMVLNCDSSDIIGAGQFVEIALDGYFLRRPISLCDYGEGFMTFIYKIVGGGTELMSRLEKGAYLDCLTGLGNTFDINKCGKKPLIIGGGVGIPPLYCLAKNLASKGIIPVAALGFNSQTDIILKQEFEKLGCEIIITTADGSEGKQGFITDAVKDDDFSFFYSCGPVPMLKKICETFKIDGQISLEERMGCGFGACMGCSVMTKHGAKRVCKEGPVFNKEDIIW